jgi:hypothetical protein
MTDVHSPATRSYNMSRIRSKDTKPELLVRKFLFSKGVRYRLHDKALPGKPDIVLPKYKTVILLAEGKISALVIQALREIGQDKTGPTPYKMGFFPKQKPANCMICRLFAFFVNPYQLKNLYTPASKSLHEIPKFKYDRKIICHRRYTRLLPTISRVG